MAPLAANSNGSSRINADHYALFNRSRSTAELGQPYGSSPPRTALPKLRSSKSQNLHGFSPPRTAPSGHPGKHDVFGDTGSGFYSSIVGAGLGSAAAEDTSMSQTILPPGHRLNRQQTSTTERLDVTGRSLSSAGSMAGSLRRPRRGSLPSLPPAFSRPLSPVSHFLQPNQSQQLQQQQSMQHEDIKSLTCPLSQHSLDFFDATDETIGRPLASTQPSKFRGSSRQVWTGAGHAPEADPFLRIVPLSQWLCELGLADGPQASFPSQRPRANGKADPASLRVSGRSWFSFAAEHGKLAKHGGKLERAFVEHLAILATSHYLPLEEVAEDLQIWRLKLHDRAARRRLADLFGRSLLKRHSFSEFFLKRKHGEDDDDPNRTKGTAGANRRQNYDDDLFGDTGGGTRPRATADASGSRFVKPNTSNQDAKGTADSGAADDGDGRDDGSKHLGGSYADEDDEKLKRKRGGPGDDDDERRRREEEDEARRRALQAAEVSANDQSANDGKKRDESDFDFDEKHKKGKESDLEEELAPRGLFRIKYLGARPATEGGRLFPGVRAAKEDDAESEQIQEDIEPDRPPATAPVVRRRDVFDLAGQFREAVRVAWERALQEVEEIWEVGVLRPSPDSCLAQGDLSTTDRKVPPDAFAPDRLLEQSRDSNDKASTADDFPEGNSIESANQSLGADAENWLDDFVGSDDIGEAAQKLRRQRYGRRLQACSRDGLSRSRAKRCWQQRVGACRRSLGSLDALGAFAEGATDSLRAAIAP
eukprot:TRINITY_DN11829_c0_g1_i2.p1 TRINITY_DN11829_c0_g1~~TRINITY_DN11829_c0_g1_i2.p1  ORF type:complete len:763 (-),score=147.26 TRINITY_DN11829_c0_g1_i2:13-2301(-)